jgi:hypothetical protein
VPSLKEFLETLFHNEIEDVQLTRDEVTGLIDALHQTTNLFEQLVHEE